MSGADEFMAQVIGERGGGYEDRRSGGGAQPLQHKFESGRIRRTGDQQRGQTLLWLRWSGGGKGTGLAGHAFELGALFGVQNFEDAAFASGAQVVDLIAQAHLFDLFLHALIVVLVVAEHAGEFGRLPPA